MRAALRPYQVAAVEAARAAILAGKRRVVIVAPTGAGKTVLAAEGLIRPAVAKGKRVLVLAHREELILQCASKLAGLPVGLIKAGFPETRTAPVQVASVQTLSRRALPPADLVVWDECHHLAAESWIAIHQSYAAAVHVGLTATPYRADGRGLGGLFDHLVATVGTSELIADGFLVAPRTWALPEPEGLRQVRKQAGDFHAGQLAALAASDRRLGTRVIETWQCLAADRCTVAFAVDVAHAHALADAWRAVGVAAAALDGATPPEERRRILEDLAQGRVQVVTNCGVLTEGFDCPRVSCVVLARPTQSRGLWRQMVGRGLRPAVGKGDCQIHDHAGCTQRHGLITDPEELTLERCRRRTEAAAPVRTCLACYAINAGGATVCAACGAPFPVPERSAPEAVDAELVEVKTSVRPLPAERRAALDAWILEAANRNYRPGWVGFRFKQRFGVWPALPMKQIAEQITERRTKLEAIKAASQAAGRPLKLGELDALMESA